MRFEQEIRELEKRIEKLEAASRFNEYGRIYAPCKNAYKDSRDGIDRTCPCWRCSPYEKI
jgi:ferredoxin-thioredoxin reductase catalytic subunit